MTVTNITAKERDAILRLDLLAFSRAAFFELYPNQPLSFEWCHELITSVLVTIRGNRVRQIINAPPRSLKSFLVSIAWPAFMLGHDPTYKIICASYSQVLANNLSTECRRLMESAWYRRLFATSLAKSAEDELVTTVGGFRIAKSVGGTLTGLGGDALIIDDPLNANDAASKAGRDSTNDWFTRTLIPRLNNKEAGAILVVMQRLHEDDLTGHLSTKGTWDKLILPAIAPADRHVALSSGPFLWRTGEPLQKREGHNVLDELKLTMSLQMFNAQYLQDPLPDTGNMLNPDWLKRYDQTPVRQPGDQVVQSWDTALKPSETSDFSAGLTFLVRNGNEYYLIDAVHKRMNFPDLCNAVQKQAAAYQPSAILIEEQGAGTPLIDECKLRRGMSGIIGIRPNKDKRTRMDGETPKLICGCLVVPKSAPWLDEFMTEYLAFPGGKHDDQIDALSQFLNWRTTFESRSSTFLFEFWRDDSAWYGCSPSPDEIASMLR